MISVSDLMLYGIRISQYLEIPHNTLLAQKKDKYGTYNDYTS